MERQEVWGKMGEKEREILPLKVAGREELEWALKVRKLRTWAAIATEFKESKSFVGTGSIRDEHSDESDVAPKEGPLPTIQPQPTCSTDMGKCNGGKTV